MCEKEEIMAVVVDCMNKYFGIINEDSQLNKSIHSPKRPIGDEYLNVSELAEYIGLSKPFIYRETHKKRIPHYTYGDRCLVFKKSEIDNWIKSQLKPVC